MSEPIFRDLYDLARLPYFDVRDGRLVRSDPQLPPAIDVHTHLALSFVAPNTLDLDRLHHRTEHYLPDHRALDFAVYQNKNFTADDLRTMTLDLSVLSLTNQGMRRTHTAPNLVREMDELGIVRSVLLAIDFPVLSHNSEAWLEVARRHEGLLGFGSVHPYTPRLVERLDALVALGARGIKVHPAVQQVAPENHRALRLYRQCGERRLPVFFHCGPVDIETKRGRELSQVYRYERALAECPDTTFVLGHSGALQLAEGLDLARRYPNAWLEVASQSLPAVRRLCAEAPPDRLMFGTDWPFYHQAIGLAKVLLATEGDEGQRRAVLHDNAARLLRLGPAETTHADRP